MSGETGRVTLDDGTTREWFERDQVGVLYLLPLTGAVERKRD